MNRPPLHTRRRRRIGGAVRFERLTLVDHDLVERIDSDGHWLTRCGAVLHDDTINDRRPGVRRVKCRRCTPKETL